MTTPKWSLISEVPTLFETCINYKCKQPKAKDTSEQFIPKTIVSELKSHAWKKEDLENKWKSIKAARDRYQNLPSILPELMKTIDSLLAKYTLEDFDEERRSL